MAKKASYIKVRLESEAGTGYRYYAKRSTKAEYKLRKKSMTLGRLTKKQAIAARTYGSSRRKCHHLRKTSLRSLYAFKKAPLLAVLFYTFTYKAALSCPSFTSLYSYVLLYS